MALTNLGACYSELGRPDEALAPTEEAVAGYRALAADNPAHLPHLAMALTNLSNRYRELGRPDEALAPTEEAVAGYRELAADNPAHLPHLAMALTNLGNRYSELGRPDEALAPTEEAVAGYRELAAENPAYLPDLAGALTNLGHCYRSLGREAEYQARWQECLQSIAEPHHPYLYYGRAAAANAGDPGAVAWLASAIARTPNDDELLAPLHEQARRHRAHDPATFDTQWATASGAEPPDWLTVDTTLLHAAASWISTEARDAERDWLADHPELLDPAADTAVSEALLGRASSQAERYRAIRVAARAEGVAGAYRPLELRILASRFTEAGPDDQRHLLADHGEDLREIIVDDYLTERASDDPRAVVAHCLITLSRAGDHNRVLDALAEPGSIADLLASMAQAHDTSPLTPAATIALNAAPTNADAALAAFYLAFAAAVTGDITHAQEGLAAARKLDPDQVPVWINQLASLGGVHPECLALIPTLTTPTQPDNP